MRPAPLMLLSRRHLLATTLLLAGTGAVSACDDRTVVQPPATSGAAETSGTGGSAVTTRTAAPGGGPQAQRLDNVLDGLSLEVALGPLVRVDETFSVLPIHVQRPADDPSPGQKATPEASWVGTIADDLLGVRPLRLVDPATEQVWVTTYRGSLSTGDLEVGASADFYATFGGVDAATTRLTVMLARTGCLEVEVVDQAAAPQVDVEKVRKQAQPDQANTAPLPLERYTEAYDGNVSDRRTDEEIVLTAANDVTFATDSAELSDQAQSVLNAAVETIKSYPDGGAMTITGHTDDVAEDAYNQTLSEQRAQSVQTRLGELTDLSRWSVQAVGKGETRPKVNDTTEEARAANRRVEISIKPTGGTKGGTKPLDPSAPVPAPTGASGPGPKGLEVADPANAGESLTIKLEKVTRRGTLLFGELEVTGTPNAALDRWFTDSRGWGLANARGEIGGLASIVAASGPTLMAGGGYVFPVDYLPADASSHRPLADLDLLGSWSQKRSTRVCVVWPDTGEPTVTVERPDDSQLKGSKPVWRLTEVPVVEG